MGLGLALAAATVLAVLPGGASAASAQRAVASPTTTSITSSKNPAVAGDTVTVRANVFVANSTIPATGTVTFFLNGLPLASGVAISGGQATYAWKPPGGTNTISATYGGSGITFLGSSGSAPLTVNKGTSTVTLTSSGNPVLFGQAVTLTATVSAAFEPQGTVTLTGSGLPAATLFGGKATFTFTRSSAGSTDLTAVYSGDGNSTARARHR